MGPNFLSRTITAVILLLITLISSCENINPVDNSKKDNGEYLELEQCNDLYSMLEFSLDVCEQIQGTGIPENWNGLSLGKVVSMDAKDSVFYDGDEIRFDLNFGTLVEAKNAGISADNRWRYGTIEFRIDKYFKEIGAQAEVKIESPFCSSTEDDHLFTGDLLLTRISSNAVKIEIKSLKIFNGAEAEVEFDGLLEYNCLTTSNVTKVWGNDFQITGNFAVKAFTDDNAIETSAQYNIVTPLLRKLEAGCNNSPISGSIQCGFLDDALSAKVEFDPFENQACDNFVRISKKDGVFDYVIKP